MTISDQIDGNFWLGTAKSGILIFNYSDRTLVQVSKANGLSNNTVVGILSDDQGYIWASTYNGISVLDSKGRVVFALDEFNGLTNNEFNRTSYFKLRDGRLAFGGIDGLNIIDPEEAVETISKKTEKRIYLTSLTVYNQEDGSNRTHTLSVPGDSTFSIHPEHNYIEIDFAMSSYLGTSEQSFAYRLIPENWPIKKTKKFPG